MFTIIIPTHDRPQLLGRALQSLADQTYQDFKVIVVDDSGSYLPPYQQLQSFKGRFNYLIRSGEPGPAESRNAGIDLVRTDYVIFLDDDDSFMPTHLETLAGQIAAQRPAIAYHDFRVHYEDRSKSPIEYLRGDAISIADVTTDSVYVKNRIPNSCLVYRRDVLANVRYPSDMRIYEDWDFLLQCLKGRQLTYVQGDGVVIHKSPPTAPENLRRGNTREDLTVEVMLELYKRYAAPNEATRLARHALMNGAGIPLAMEDC